MIVMAAVAVLGAGCSSEGSDGATTTTDKVATSADTTTSSTPAPIDDQRPPEAINGIAVQGDTIWVASIKDDEVLQVRRKDGAIVGRYDTKGAGPDDVAVAPDGSVYVTGFGNGDVGHISKGEYSVLTTITPGINPLEFTPDGTLYVGTYGPKGTLYRVPLDGSAPVLVATDLPDINAFGAIDDTTLVAPAGGIGGPGAAAIIDLDAGTVADPTIALPKPVAAGATDADGQPFLLANITGEVMAIDVEAGTHEVVRTVTEGAPFDNLSFASDGTLYLSSFTAAAITEVKPNGDTRVIPIGA